jgi:hypothetical protein
VRSVGKALEQARRSGRQIEGIGVDELELDLDADGHRR